MKAALGQAPLTSTTTTLVAKESGGVGHWLLKLVATVNTAQGPVSGGQVVFGIDGTDLPGVQIVGDHPAAGHLSGTAQVVLSLPAGQHKVLARYLGTSSFSSSRSNAEFLVAPDPSRAQLTLQESASSTFGYMLASSQQITGVGGEFTLSDVSGGVVLGRVRSGSGQATLATSELSLPLGFVPNALTVADLSGTGAHDLIVGNPGQGTISVLFQQANLSWSAPQTVTVGSHPTMIVTQDFNGDGLEDIAVLNAADGTVDVLLQNAQVPGTFKPATTVKVGTMPFGMASGDVDEDGLPDLVISNFADNTLSVLLNNANSPGTFVLGSSVPTQGGPTGVALGEFLGAGHLDAAVTNYYDGTLSIFAGTPGTSNLFTEVKNVNPVGTGPTAVVVTDLNGDGRQDLAVCNSLDGTISILPAQKSMPGQFPEQYIVDSFNQPTSVAVLGNWGSGAPADLVVGDAADGTISILHNDGSARFLERTVLTVGEGLSSTASLYRSSGGSYSIVATDPSLQDIHLAIADWQLSGEFSTIALPSGAFTHRLQAAYVTELNAAALHSNELIIPSASPKAQTISFPALVATSYGKPALSLSAAASSGLPVQFWIKSGPAVVQGGKLSLMGAGTVIVEASQSGDSTYAAAGTVERSLIVNQASLTVTPSSAQRSFGVPNPPFSGTIAGLIGTDDAWVNYSSYAGVSTGPGTYNVAPLGIMASLKPGRAQQNYNLHASVGTLTICPTPIVYGPSVPGCTLVSAPLPSPTIPFEPVSQPGSGSTAPTPGNPTPTSPPSSTPAPVASLPVLVPKTPSPSRPVPVIVTSGFPPAAPIEKPKKSKDSGASPIIVPIPIGSPVTWPSLPSLPSLSSLFSGGTSRPVVVASVPANAGSSALLLLADARLPAVPGWLTLSITLECPGDWSKAESVLLSSGDAAIATLVLKANQEVTARVRHSSDTPAELTAHFAGDGRCAASTSKAVLFEGVRPTILETTSSRLDDLIEQRALLNLPQQEPLHSGESEIISGLAGANQLWYLTLDDEGASLSEDVPWMVNCGAWSLADFITSGPFRVTCKTNVGFSPAPARGILTSLSPF